MQLFQHILEIRIVRPIRRIDPAKYHGGRAFIARQGLVRGALCVGNGIAHARIRHIFDGSANVSYLAGAQYLAAAHLRCEYAHLRHIELFFAAHNTDAHARPAFAVNDAHKADRAFIVVVIAVKDQCFERCVNISLRRRDQLCNHLQHLVHIQPCLGGNFRAHRGIQSNILFYLVLHHLRTRQIHLIDNRHDLQVVVQG